MKVKFPASSISIVPLNELTVVVTPATTATPSIDVTISVSPLGSVSLFRTLPSTATFIGVVRASSLASGLSFVSGSGSVNNAIVAIAVSVAPPGSDMVYSNVGTPLKVVSVGV